MEAATIYGTLGDDLSRWNQILVDLKKARTTVDAAEDEKAFGPIIVSYSQVCKLEILFLSFFLFFFFLWFLYSVLLLTFHFVVEYGQ